MPGEPIMPQSERSPESLAKKHPEYQKWMAAAEAAEGGRDVEDAMSHVESGDADLAYKRARLYSLRKAVGQDVRGFNTEGHHLQQAQ